MSLCVITGARQDLLNTGITKAELDVLAAGPLDDYGYRWTGNYTQRLFVLSDGMIRRFFDEESRRGRLWNPDEEILKAWAPPTLQ